MTRISLTPWARDSVTEAELRDLYALPLPSGASLSVGSRRRPTPLHARVFREGQLVAEAWADDALTAAQLAVAKASEGAAA